MKNKKIMISLRPETEKRVRQVIRHKYYGKIGAMSIIFEQALELYFAVEKGRKQARRKVTKKAVTFLGVENG